MNILTVDLLEHHIFLYATIETVMIYAPLWKRGHRLFTSMYFWKMRAQQDFNFPPKVFEATYLSPAMRYVQLAVLAGEICRGADLFLNFKPFIDRALQFERTDLVQSKITDSNRAWIESRYVLYGLTEIPMNDPSDPAYTKEDLQMAVTTNRLEIVKYLFSIQQFEFDFHDLIGLAIASHHLEMIAYLLDRFQSQLDWYVIATFALISESVPVFEYIFPRLPSLDWGDIYHFMYETGNVAFILYVKGKIGLIPIRPNLELRSAIDSGKLEFIKYVIRSHPNYSFDYGAILKCCFTINQNIEVIQYIATQFSPDRAYWINFIDIVIALSINPVDFIRIIPYDLVFQHKDLFLKSLYAHLLIDPFETVMNLKYLNCIETDWTLVLRTILERNEQNLIEFVLQEAGSIQWDEVMQEPIIKEFPSLRRYLEARRFEDI